MSVIIWKCTTCESTIVDQPDITFCAKCGTKLIRKRNQKPQRCPERGHVLDNGDCFDGDILDGKPHGKGMLWTHISPLNSESTISTTYNISGEFKHGALNGQGELVWDDELPEDMQPPDRTYRTYNYIGEFKHTKLHGLGRKSWGIDLANGSIYLGFEAGKFKNGEFISGEADYYSRKGHFIGGRLNGEGVIYHSDVTEIGIFKDGKSHGNVLWKHPVTKKVIFKGKMKKGKRHGFGKRTDGIFFYEGEWKNDIPCGRGILFSKDVRGRAFKWQGTITPEWRQETAGERLFWRFEETNGKKHSGLFQGGYLSLWKEDPFYKRFF